MTTDVTVVEANTLIAAQPGWPQDKIDLVKDTVAKGASDNELQMFLALADKYQLDPFAKEIWCIKDDRGGMRIQAARDGFLAIANRHPSFDGMNSDVVFDGDGFARTDAGGVTHTYGDRKTGKITGAYALIYRSDRRIPTYFFARWSVYNRPGNNPKSPWKEFPDAMILKVAEANSLKRAFSISGLEGEGETPAVDEPRPSFEAHRVQGRSLRPIDGFAGTDDDAAAAIEFPDHDGDAA